MGTLILGAGIGCLMASVFTVAAVLMLFGAARNTPPALVPIFEKVPPSSTASAKGQGKISSPQGSASARYPGDRGAGPPLASLP